MQSFDLVTARVAQSVRSATSQSLFTWNGDADLTIDTGFAELNKATGLGGLPRGRLVELYGPEEAGKTTLAIIAAQRVQQSGLRVAYIDAEHKLSPKYAQSLHLK